MTWVKVDDGYVDHPKMAAVGPLGQALWLAGLAYCNRNLTDGFIPWAVARTLISWEFLGPLEDDGSRKVYTVAMTTGLTGDDVAAPFVIDLLLAAGLWEELQEGYRVHDYPDYQPTKAQVLADRAQKIAAGRAGGMAAARARGPAPAAALAQAGAQAESYPVPVPVPVPIPGPTPRAGATSRNDGEVGASQARVAAGQRAIDQERARQEAILRSGPPPKPFAEAMPNVTLGRPTK